MATEEKTQFSVPTSADTPDVQSEPSSSDRPAAAPQNTQRPVQVDTEKAVTSYANFCRVTGTPEELIIDFGLNTHPMATPDQPLDIDQRIVLNHFTAKRLLAALQMSLQRHEAAFGVLETNIQKRIQPQREQQPISAK